MILDISDIIRSENRSCAFSFEGIPQQYTEYGESAAEVTACHVSGKATYMLGRIYVDAELLYDYSAECGRCNKEVSGHSEEHLYECFYNKRFSMDDDDTEDCYDYEGNTIELSKMVTDALLLSVPYKVLCDENCKGLCPHCGADLNKGECGCDRKNIDPRMDVLKELLDKRLFEQ